MIPTAFPAIAPVQSVGELFGPLAPIAVLGVILALVILVAMLAAEAPQGQPPARPERTRGRRLARDEVGLADAQRPVRAG